MNTAPLVTLAEGLRREHLVVEGCYWSCAATRNDADYCGDLPRGECTCGADAHNAKVDVLVAALRALSTT